MAFGVGHREKGGREGGREREREGGGREGGRERQILECERRHAHYACILGVC
jgi:hypothetical protein